jgi:hypothetical protein
MIRSSLKKRKIRAIVEGLVAGVDESLPQYWADLSKYDKIHQCAKAIVTIDK